MLSKLAVAAAFVLGLSAPAFAAHSEHYNAYLAPFPAHKVVGNVYFVGSKGQASYLITTRDGNILINSGVVESPPMIKESIEKLGFKYADTKILLISHAHFDHDAGSARIIKETGARYEVMDADVDVVESGGKTDFAYGDDKDQDFSRYPAVKVSRVLHDGDTVSLGGVVLTAHKTAGHTKGCTTWTLKVNDGGKSLNVAIVGSPNVNPGFALVNNEKYPGIAQDYEKTFQVMKSLPVDIFLGAHGDYYGMPAKFEKMKPGAANPFIDPAGYKAYVANREEAYRKNLARQKAGGKP